MTPIDAIFETLDWKAEPPQEPGELPHVTHSGVLSIAGMRLRCYRLSDGRAIINAEDMRPMLEAIGITA